MLDSAGEPVTMFGTIQDITDRKQIEEAHRQERILLRTVVDNLPSAIFVKDAEYRKTLVNSQHVEKVAAHLGLLGLDSTQDLLGKTDFEVYPKELAEKYFEDDRRIISDGESVLNREESIVNADGRTSWFFMSKVPLRDKDGKILGLVGISTDVTRLKEAEEAAKQERILLRTVIDNIPHSIYVKDSEYRKIMANPEDVSHTGMQTEAEVCGKTDFDLFPKELASKFHADDEMVIKKGKSVVNKEDHLIMPDGTLRWMLTTKVPLRDGNGNVTGLVGIGIDVTDRRRMEELLIENEERLRTLFENASIGIYRTTPDGHILFANPAMIRILGFQNLDELVKYNLEDEDHYAAEYPRPKFRELVEGKGSVIGLESRQVRKDGSSFWVRENAHVVRNKDGKAAYYEGTIEDITDRKEIEGALRRSEQMLQQITNSVDDAIYSIDGQTAEFTYLSPVFERKLGCTLSEIEAMGGRWAFLRKTIQSENLPEDDPIIKDLQAKVINYVPLRENWWKCKDGTLLYLEDKSVPVYEGEKLVRVDGVLRDITEWKISEDTKQRERNLLRTLIDNIPYPIYVKDKECRKIVANPADVRNMGLKSETEAIGKTDFELYPTEIAEKFFADDQAVVRDGRSVLNREEYFYSPDGKKRWLLTTKMPWLDENGKIIGLVGMGAEITEMKAAQDALRQSEKELRMLFESMKDVILVLDKDGRFMRVSPTDDSLLYKPGAEIVGRTGHEIFHKDQAEYFLSIIRKTLESGQTQNAEYAINIRGEERWRMATISPLTNETVLWVARDITERKLMEKEISDSEKKYRELVENALVGVYRMTLSGKIIYANNAMADMLEYDSPEELMSVTSFSLYKNIQEREHFTKELRSYGKTGKSMEVEFLTKGGKTRNVLLSASTDGEIISGMAKDITDIRTLERQFIQTQQLEGLGNIAAGIAHDFNNLLGVILGYADLLTQSAFDQKKFQRGTQAIMKSGERGKALVKQTVDFCSQDGNNF